MRRTPFVLTLALAAAACGPDSPGSQEAAADLVLQNGRVVTMDAAMPEAEAIAIRGYEIAAVGTSEEIAAWVGDNTEVIDLEGRLAIPGLIEGHGHYLGLGRAQQILDLTEVTTWDEIVTMVAEAAAAAPAGTWINGRGWHQEKWDVVPEPSVDGVPLHDDLSAISPDNPVLLGHASGHAAFANEAALDAAGITASTPDPAGGTIVKDGQGRPTGLLRETAQRLVGAAQAEAESGRSQEELDAEFRERVRLAGEEALSKGVTSFHDAGTGFDAVERLAALDAEGALPIRLYVMVRGSNEEMAEKLAGARHVAEGNGHLTVRSIKRQIDGALGSHGAWLLEPYVDLPGNTGLTLEEPADIRRTAELALEHGYQLNTHAIGDRANREVLDIYEDVFQEQGVNGDTLRWRIEHAQHLNPADVPRFAELGVIASMQGIHTVSDGPWIPQRLGDTRTGETSYLFRSLLDAGVVVTNGTDVPVEDIDPIASYAGAVTRIMNNGEKFFPGEGMSRMEGLAAYTSSNAYAEFSEDRKGTLSVGKLADITVLSADILEIPEAEIGDTRADLTIVGGEVRYRRSGS